MWNGVINQAIKYLFKFINKGQDRITAGLLRSQRENGNEDDVDEIQEYYNCRYVSASVASWRILGFEIHHRTPSVDRLSLTCRVNILLCLMMMM